jgi:transcriptional regulator with XRE-family HTH domain
MGRRSTYTDEIAAEICQQIADGKSLRDVCKSANLPSRSTVSKWLKDEDKADFQDRYGQAEIMRADNLFEDCVTIAEELPETADRDDLARAKLQIDTKKWAAGKLNPKRYGDMKQMDIKNEINLGSDLGRLLGEISGNTARSLPSQMDEIIELEHQEVIDNVDTSRTEEAQLPG